MVKPSCYARFTVKQIRTLSGFSLMEVMVGIGIIVLLAALLYPAAINTLENGRAAACVGNLRQLGVKIYAAAAENNGYFPGKTTDGTLWWKTLGQEDDYATFDKYMVCRSDKNPNVYSFTYNGEKKTIKCSYWYYLYLGYGTSLNNPGDSSSGLKWPALKLGLISNAQRVPMVVDYVRAAGAAPAVEMISDADGSRIFGRHKDGRLSNVLMVDGHVAQFSGVPDSKKGEWSWTPTY